jgi:hypothetical protein
MKKRDIGLLWTSSHSNLEIRSAIALFYHIYLFVSLLSLIILQINIDIPKRAIRGTAKKNILNASGGVMIAEMTMMASITSLRNIIQNS